jgi:hypothetical protein
MILRLRINKVKSIFVELLVAAMLKRRKWIFCGGTEVRKVSGLFPRYCRHYWEFSSVVCPAEAHRNGWFQEFWGENRCFFDILVFFHETGCC